MIQTKSRFGSTDNGELVFVIHMQNSILSFHGPDELHAPDGAAGVWFTKPLVGTVFFEVRLKRPD